MHLERGSLSKARRLLRRALRIARRHRLTELTAVAYHNLFALEFLSGNWQAGEAHAVAALELYPDESPNRPRLARDLAYRTMLRGAFADALPLAWAVLPHFSAPAERALVWSDIVRAAGGAGELVQFEQAWAQAFMLLEAGPLDPFTINILLNLAHGAASRGDSFRARLMAERALNSARERNESGSIFEAEALLASLQQSSVDVPAPTPRRESGRTIRAFLNAL